MAALRLSLPELWADGRVSNERKKSLLRAPVAKVVLHRPAPDRARARIVWVGGDTTTVEAPVPVVTYAELSNPGALVAEVVRRSKAGQTDRQIAVELTAAGFHAPLSDRLSAGSVARIRHDQAIDSPRAGLRRDGCPGWLTTGQAAARIGEHTGWISHNIRKGRIAIRKDRYFGVYLFKLSDDPFSEEQYDDLLTALFNVRARAPSLGSPPSAIQAKLSSLPAPTVAAQPTPPAPPTGFEPIKIVGVLADEVGEPPNDGTRGCGLYSVPFKLSRRPPADWATHFVNKWNHLPQWTSRRRPGIAEVRGDRIVLTRTTLEEVKATHRDTLKLVVEVVNQDYAVALKRKQDAERAEAERAGQHRNSMRRLADNIKFD